MRFGAALVLASLLASAVVGISATSASAAPGDPFDPADPLVFVAQNSPTQLFRAVTGDSGAVAFTPEGPASPTTYNAIAYRTADNYIYGIVNAGGPLYPPGSLLRIGQSGAVTIIASGLGASISGAFGPSGLYYYIVGSTLNAFNVVTGNLVSSVPITGATQAADIAFKDGYFWSLAGTSLTRMNPATGNVVAFPLSGVEVSGAAWTFGNGNLGFSANGSGNVFQIAVDDPGAAQPTIRVIAVSSGPSSTNNDGTASPGLPTDLGVAKEGPTTITAGGQVSYTLTVTNHGLGNSSGFTVTDAVPAELTNVQATSSANCSVTGNEVSCSGGRLVAGSSATITITADVPIGTTGCVTNAASVLANEMDPVLSNNTSEVTSCPRALVLTKSSDATAETRNGDTVTYTVTATNIGPGAFTAADPAVVSDDMGGVLDDALYNNDAQTDQAGELTYTSPRLMWSGALDAGETVIVTYSVKLTGAGDGNVKNVAFPGNPAITPNCVGGIDPITGLPCIASEFDLPRLRVSKTADTSALPAIGSPVTYVVTVTNVGPGDFTATSPATATDSWTAVIDDADLAGPPIASSGSLDVASDGFEWDGVLVAGESATITTMFTYNGDGDQTLRNLACVPNELTAPGAPPCVSVKIPGSGLSYLKSSNPAAGETVRAGDEITYTLMFTNTGNAPAAVAATDDLVRLLDDADIVSGPTSSNAALTANFGGTEIEISGLLPVGETTVVTYTAAVRAFADQGDHQIGNVVSDPGGVCAGMCQTEHLVQHLSVLKSSDAVAGVNTGDTVSYTVTVINDGGSNFTASVPATAKDDLTGVLDDAEFDGTATATSGTVDYAEPVLTWSGPLEAGEASSFTYSVLVTNGGDNSLVNAASTLCDDGEDCREIVVTPLPHIVPDKVSNPTAGAGLVAGDVVTYTLTFTNGGQAAGAVDSTDDLSDVLDDAELTGAPVSDTPGVTATRTGDTLRIVGTLGVGLTASITYQVTIRPDGERGNNLAANTLFQDTPPNLVCTAGECVPPSDPTTKHPIGEVHDTKTVNPASGTTLRPGDVATYTLNFSNIGMADVDVDRQDALTGVLDDADLTKLPAASDPALTVSAVIDGRVTITGTLGIGQTVTVSYQATVREDGARGDDQLGNFLVDTGAAPPASCSVGDEACTVNYVSDVEVVKSSNPRSGTQVTPGEEVTFTLTFRNASTSAAAASVAVDYTDHMADVLDDATLTGTPQARGSLAANVVMDKIFVTGALSSGASATVTYTVTVAKVGTGDGQLGNVVAITGTEPICAENSSLCTSHTVSDPPTTPIPSAVSSLPNTGASLDALGVLALALLGSGSVLVMVRRRLGRLS